MTTTTAAAAKPVPQAPAGPIVIARKPEPDEMRVGKDTNPQSLASAIAHAIYDNHTVRLRAIGAGAVNQAVKAVIIASGFTAPRGVHLAIVPGFSDAVAEEGGTISAVILRIVQFG